VGDLQKKWSIRVCEILERHDLKLDWSEVNLPSRSGYFDLCIWAQFLQHKLIGGNFLSELILGWVEYTGKRGWLSSSLCKKERGCLLAFRMVVNEDRIPGVIDGFYP